MLFLKRVGLVLLATFAYSIGFPIIAGLPIDLLILTIPMVYAWYFIPGAFLGATVGVLLVVAPNWFKPGTRNTMVIGGILGPIYTWFWLNRLFDGLIYKVATIRYDPLHTSMQDHIIVMFTLINFGFYLIGITALGGVVCGKYFKGEDINNLLKSE